HEDEHRAPNGPALTHAADHPAEHEDLRHRDEEDGEFLEEGGEAGRFLERYGGVRVVEAAAVRPELLDGDLGGHGAACDRLVPTLEGARRGGARPRVPA